MCLQSVGVLPGLISDGNGRSLFDTADPVDQMEEFVRNYSMWGMVGYIDKIFSLHGPSNVFFAGANMDVRPPNILPISEAKSYVCP